jgi:hypothetical protein
MSEGVGEARPEAEGELALAHIALDDGDLRHAAAHLGNAIASDPALRETYSTLDDLAVRADDALALFPMTGKPGRARAGPGGDPARARAKPAHVKARAPSQRSLSCGNSGLPDGARRAGRSRSGRR